MSGPVLLRIKLRYDDIDTMVARFAPNVGKAGLFLPTKSVQPIGAEVKFELRLANDTAVIVGLGRVKVAREYDAANPRAACGIGVELMRVTRESREVILKMLERRRAIGLVDVAIPSAEDVDAARRVDAPSEPAAPQPMPVMVSAPIETSEPSLLTAPRRPSGPIAVQKVVAIAREPLSAPIAALGPEPSRKHVRRSLQDVIASASAAIAIAGDMFGTDDEVDVKAVLARARTLAAGTDLDAELEALRESAAAPLAEITVEAASAELARALGGAPVSKRNRAAWAPPPPVEVPKKPVEPVEVVEAPQKSSAAIVVAALAPEPVIEAKQSFFEPEPGEPEPSEPAEDEHEIDDAAIESAEEDVSNGAPAHIITHAAELSAVADLPVGGYIRDDDEPEPTPQEQHHAAADAVAAAAMEAIDSGAEHDALEPMLAAVAPITEPRNPALSPDDSSGLLIDDDVDPSMFEAGNATVGPAVEALPDGHDDFSLDSPGDRTQFGGQALADDQPNDNAEPSASAAFEGYRTEPAIFETEAASAARVDAELAQAEAALADEDFGFSAQEQQHLQAPEHLDDEPAGVEENVEELEEIDDFEILDEEDAEDGEQDDLVVADVRQHAATPPRRSHTDDFVNRLELSNTHDAAPAPAEGDPLAGFRDREDSAISYSGDAPNSAYQLQQPAYQDPLAGFAEEPPAQYPADYDDGYRPHQVHAARIQHVQPAAPPQQPIWDPASGQYVYPNPYPDHDPHLENALEALDPDLDDLGQPAPPPARNPIDKRQKRAMSEDEGIVIDFDDDEE